MMKNKNKDPVTDTYAMHGEDLRMNVSGMTANQGEPLHYHYALLSLESGLSAETVASLEAGRAAQLERFHRAFRNGGGMQAEIKIVET